MLHMQHHILCNISYVVIAESMGKSLKTTIIYSAHAFFIRLIFVAAIDSENILQPKFPDLQYYYYACIP